MICCCLRQLKCLLCGSGCACCCSFLPPIKQSTSTRLVYTIILIIGTLLCASMMSQYMFGDIMNVPSAQVNSPCKEFDFGSKCFSLTGSMAVYRLSFAFILFFFVLMILTANIKTSKSYRAYLHNGFWLWKIILLVFLIVFSFKIPFSGLIKDVWMYTGMFAAVAYIIFNMTCMIALTYSWTENIVNRQRCKLFWYLILILLIIFFIGVSIALTIYLYINFVPSRDCYFNNLFISTMSITCFIFFLFAFMVAAKTKKTYIYLLPTSFVSAYVLILTWSALTSIPRSDTEDDKNIQHVDLILNSTIIKNSTTLIWCYSSLSIVHIDQKYVSYISVFLSIFMTIYTSISNSTKSKDLSNQINRPEREICFGCCVKKVSMVRKREKSTNGQTLINDEAEGVVYSYSFFHFVFVLAIFHNMVQLTNWNRPDTAQLDTFGRNMPTVYIKVFTAIVCILTFGCTLLVSCFCPKRFEQGRTETRTSYLE